ncbi:MAG: tRNA (guanine-N1)-methyltransferase [Patiriisocius sp.]|uniref:tRNA (guanine-N1)-methyltransferase n=1 Tax=Patiriisocius sp. TaxID=2822396 RepID=UPI003EF31F18
MNFKVALLSSLLFISISLNAQTSDETENQPNTIEKQFVEIFEGSNNYKGERGQRYEVVKVDKLNRLKKSISDSISTLKNSNASKDVTIGQQESEIATLESTLKTTQNELSASQEKEDGIELFGILMSKSTYNTLMWSIIGILLIGLIIFIFRFKNSNTVTKESKEKLAETEAEFEDYRQKKLEELQQTRRKLQDEINKNK